MKWHFQFTPNDPYDYDSVAEMVLADLTVGGKPTKVLMDANRNGFFYVLDRTDGKLIAANQSITKQTWAKGIDEERAADPSEITDKVRRGRKSMVWPGPRRQELEPDLVQSADRPGLCQHSEFRHALQAERAGIQGRPDLLGRGSTELDLAGWRARRSEGDRSHDRQGQVGSY